MVYTIADLVTFARSRDERLADTAVYPDATIEQFIEEAFAVAQDIRPIFATKETYDLYNNVVVDELTEMEIILQKEPQSIRVIADYDDLYFNTEVTANNHIIVTVNENVSKPTDYKVTVHYFYYPLMPMVEIELSVDSYRLIKEAIGAVVCAELRDYEQENYHRSKAKLMAQESAYDLEKDLLKVPTERLWDGSWV
jgi:hypothetical protein